MKHLLFLALMAATGLSSNLCFAQQSTEQLSAQKQLQHEGYFLASLLDSSKEEIVNGLMRTGSEEVLDQSPDSFKVAYSGSVGTIQTNSDVSVSLQGPQGTQAFSEATNQDLSDAVFAFSNAFSSQPNSFYQIKCIDISGQGMNRIIWCGLKK